MKKTLGDSLKPYLIEGFYKWCVDTKQTPFIKINIHPNNILPQEHKNNENIVLSLSPKVIKDFSFSDFGINFITKFDDENFKTFIHYDSIEKIFTKENGYGLEFSSFSVPNNGDNKYGHLTVVK